MAQGSRPAFGAWLKEYRRVHGLTRAELGRRIGCSAETIHKIETGERRPSRQIAELLAANLQIAQGRREAFVDFARTSATGTQPRERGTGDGHTIPKGRVPFRENPEDDQKRGQENDEWPHAADALLLQSVAYSPPTNLRPPLTRLIGRQKELQEIRNLILRGKRLLTLTGPPGIGKTRLAIGVGLDLLLLFPQGAFFVPLAAARRPNDVMEAIVETLAIEESGEEPLQALSQHLREREMLLVLDNFEQVVEAGTHVVQLLEECPGVRAIVTSREPLNVWGEQRFVVPPLGVPDVRRTLTAERAAEHSSVALFAERAEALLPDFRLTDHNAPTVAAICATAQGLPLAIELLVPHLKILSAEELLQRLRWEDGGQQLQLLSGVGAAPLDLSERHRSLRSAIDWSYDLLNEKERRLFARFSIFRGGCTLAAIEAVCDAPGDLGDSAEGAYTLIGSLLDKNLIKEDTKSEAQCERRFAMLEPLRHYAGERLRDEQSRTPSRDGSDEWDAVSQWHAEYFLALAETADPQLAGRDQEMWLSRLECDHDNLRAALEWMLEHERAEMAARLATSLVIFWDIHGHFTEGRRWLDLVLERFGDRLPASLRADVLKGAGSLAQAQGELERSIDLIGQSLVLRRDTGDMAGLASSLTNLSLAYLDQGDIEQAYGLLDEGILLYRSLGERSGLAAALSNQGLVELYRKRYAHGMALFEESLALQREMEDRLGCATALCNLGEAARQQGDYARARGLIAEALDLASGLDHKGLILASVGGLATIAVSLQHPLRAARLFGAEEALREALAAPLPAADHEEYMSYVRTARAMTDEATFVQAWQQGRALDLHETIAYALSDEG